MSVVIELYKIKYKEFKKCIADKSKKEINNELFDKVMSEFGTILNDNDYIILHNEFYEDGICTWNMFDVVSIFFGIDSKIVSDAYYESREELVSYKEKYEAYYNLGLKGRIVNE